MRYNRPLFLSKTAEITRYSVRKRGKQPASYTEPPQRAKAPRGTGPSLVKQDVEGASVFERLAVATRKLDDVRIPEFGGVQFSNLQLIACACV